MTAHGPVDPTWVDVQIGERVHAAMWRARITQRQVAEALDVDQGSVSRRLRGRTPWKVSELVVVADLCGVPVTELLPPHDVFGALGGLTRGDALADSRAVPAERAPLEQSCGRAA